MAKEANRLQEWQFAAINAINNVIVCEGHRMEDRHNAINLIREHLEARAEQTAPPWPEDEPTDDISDLLGL